ncbi:MATE family efflux transporter [Nocardia cyriacigeorgica]|uniref:Probable multidrug resistance protein NorM n=2 Tax=Nocardia cyriacigeorgica TaxID=135487 RepID=H6QZQ2_NOCCG|nr:MATE family efflux transporter [Nocardia cyriacigeorgica]MBF6081864.1 MATE family efflux transporter [Nocardia cyriacigeorgica]MBF6287326.1 MATE family efflux transporter [Nocardia cyriacigeorgica]MBF6427937.1 MATE family efflux transporter [Nocardia cyriacigeorgica]NEW34006.1 MATE family efflux transporter [Nocardia cyriacigeorgica]CCF65414.1 putative Multidrug and toxic compound extrusion transporter [Nocardia cyriacigeorgica GUH-2]
MNLSDFRADGKRLTALATPIALTQLAQIAVSTTNIALMGSLGVRQVAAGGLAIVLFNQIRTMCVGLITGSGNQIASAVSAAGKRGVSADGEVRDVVRSSFLIATLAGLLGGVVLVGLGWSLQWLGQDAGVLADARPMMVALAPGLLPCLWFQVLRQYTVGMQKPQALLLVTLGSVALNLVLALTFMHGWLGLPALGLTGIGVATSLVFLITFAVFWAMVRRDTELAAGLSLRPWPVRMTTVRAELKLGVPISLTYGSEAGMFSVLALVMGSIGPAALAAHNVVYQIIYIVFQVAIGLSHGASILVSHAVARDEFDHARALAWLALRHAAVIAAITGVAYVVIPELVLRPFLDPGDTATIEVAKTLLLIGIVLQFFDAAQNIGNGLLRGLKATKAGFRLSLVGYWLVGLPTALLLAFPAGLGAAGVWWGLTAGLAATAGLMLRRYFTLLDTAAREHPGMLPQALGTRS